jgi:hypothetical protein
MDLSENENFCQKWGKKYAQPSTNIICADVLIINWKIKKGGDKENSKRETGNLLK